MKNRKVHAMVCWGLSAMDFLGALYATEGKAENVTKQVLFILAMGIAWLAIGTLHWRKRNNT